MKHQQSSFFVDVQQYQLHVRQLTPLQQHRAPVLMLHGVLENGRIFYHQSGKGLGCFLADQGFRVYCPDFAGRGLSQPLVADGLFHSQQQLICQDIPALIEHLYQLHQQKIHLVCHSWGGVLLAASLARFPRLTTLVQSCSYFGTKRRISQVSFSKRIKIDWVWNRLAPWLCRRYGFLPAKQWRLGADNEPAQFLLDTVQWIQQLSFVDPTDQFDYAAAARHCAWPNSWFFAAVNDKVLGHPADVQLFMAETQQQDARFTMLGRAYGDTIDFDHISMLTHPAAKTGHFQRLSEWLQQQTPSRLS
jgi:pimeloyl-ACP methyl ester carboxylesterase